jgi:hypothetical protein
MQAADSAQKPILKTNYYEMFASPVLNQSESMPAPQYSHRNKILNQNNSIDMKMMTCVPAHIKGGSSYMSLRKTTSKTNQDLSEFLNFYNQHSYMGVARSIGKKLSKTSK